MITTILQMFRTVTVSLLVSGVFVYMVSENAMASEVESQSVSASNEALSASEEMVAMTRKMQTYEAQFSQKIKDPYGNIKDESKGRFVIKKPNRFVWETASPFEQKIISNGVDLYTYDMDLDQVNIQTLNTALGNTPILLIGSDEKQLSRNYNINKMPGSNDASKTFELLPVDKGQAFERMLVLFKDQLLKEIILMDTLGQQTVVDFTDIKMNHDIDDKTFSFSIPEDVDVLDSRDPVESLVPPIDTPTKSPSENESKNREENATSVDKNNG